MSEQMRSEFEAWFESLNHYKPEKQITPSGWYYCDRRVDNAWKAWQASRAALCVELPAWEQYDDDMVSGAATAINDCQDAIHAAGVKTR